MSTVLLSVIARSRLRRAILTGAQRRRVSALLSALCCLAALCMLASNSAWAVTDEAIAQFTQAVARARAGKRQYAEILLKELQSASPLAIPPQVLGDAYLEAGALLMTVGEWSQAEEPLRKAVTLFSQLRDKYPDQFAAATGNLAKIYLSQWRVTDAGPLISELRQFIDAAGKANDAQGLGLQMLEAELMMIKGKRQRFDAIVGQLHEAIISPGPTNSAVSSYLGSSLVKLLIAAGEPKRAYLLAHELESRFQERSPSDIDAIWAKKLSEAKFLSLFNELEARDKILHEALQVKGLSAAMRANVLLFIGNDQLSMGNSRAALAKYLDVIDTAKDLITPTNIAAIAYVQAAEVEFDLGQLAASDDHVDLALDALLKNPGVNPTTAEQTLTSIAYLALRRGRLLRAHTLIQNAEALAPYNTMAGPSASLMESLVEFGIADGEKNVASLVTQEDKLSQALSRRVTRRRFRSLSKQFESDAVDTVFSRALDAYFALSRDLHQSRKYVERSFFFAQALDIGGVDDALIASASRSQVIDKRARELLWQKQIAQNELERDIGALDGQSADQGHIEGELRRIDQELAANSSVDLRPLEEPWCNVEEVQRNLRPGQALVMYRAGRNSYYAWVITPDSEHFVNLDTTPKSIRENVAKLRRSVTPSEAGMLGDYAFDSAEALYGKLLAPLEAILGGTSHIFIVPDHTLLALPFSALVRNIGDTGPKRWAMSRYSFSTLTSPASLNYLKELGHSSAPEPFVGFGAPVLLTKTASSADVGDQQRDGRRGVTAVDALSLAPLPEAEAELRALSRNFGASYNSVFVGIEATKARLMRMPLNQFRVIAFATHGLLAGELSGVAEPGLVLSPPPGSTKSEDEILTAGDVLSLKLDANWVILSACNTAAGDGGVGSGLSGLTRSFVFAGARALLISNWAVDSQSAAQITTDVSRLIATHEAGDKAEALQKAMLRFVEKSKGQRTEHPFYWAPFAVFGSIDE